MPTVQQGQERSVDVIGSAIHIMQIAIREIKVRAEVKRSNACNGLAGLAPRTKSLSSQQRTEIAKTANPAWWA